METELCVLDKLELAYDFIADAIREAPQLYDCHLDQALLVLVISMKRARRSPRLHRRPKRLRGSQDEIPF
jgi:hypothetical protein